MIVTFNKQQLSELFNRDHFESLFKIEFSHPKNPKMCDPILVTLLKMRPHSSQSSRENATPSSGTSPLASYKEVTPPGDRGFLFQSVQTVRMVKLSQANGLTCTIKARLNGFSIYPTFVQQKLNGCWANVG